MNNTKTLFRKYFVVVIAQIIIGIGVAFLVTSGMGNDPMGVMVSGLSQKTGIAFGAMTNMINVAIFILLLIFYRKRLSVTTFITAVLVGWTVDPVISLINAVKIPAFVNNFIFPIFGCFIIGAGVAFYLSIDFGASITDNVILFICDKANKGYSFGCYLLYIVYFSVGLLLGGVWGYATVISLLFTGKVVDFLMPKFKKTVGEWVLA